MSGRSPSLFSEAERRSLTWDSYILYERLEKISKNRSAADSDPITVPEDSETVQQWCSEVNALTPSRLAHILKENENITVSPTVLDELKSPPDEITVERWVDQLEEICAFIIECEPATTCEHESRSDGSPFIEFFSSLIKYGHRELQNQGLQKLPSGSLAGLNDQLLNDLIELGAEVLYTEFRTYQLLSKPTDHDSGSPQTEDGTDRSTDDPETTVNKSTVQYDAFIHKLHTEDQLRSLFTTYPLFARWTVTLIDQWVETASELDNRLSRDWDALCRHFNISDHEDLPAAVSVDVTSSDRHGHGRTVVILNIDDEQVVYKPKSVQSEIAFQRFCQEISDKTKISLSHKKTVLPRGSYGWVSVVESEFVSPNTVNEYYRRAGALLAATYLLYLNDGHYENVIATSTEPVLVDVETILTPEISFRGGKQQSTRVSEASTGVYWTGLLKQHRGWEGGERKPGNEIVINGFTKPQVPLSQDSTRNRWKYTNTDGMELSQRERDVQPIDEPSNVPQTHQGIERLSEYIDAVQIGFTSVCHAVATGRLTFPANFENLRSRVVLRDTSEYVGLLSSLQSPKTLMSGQRATYVIDELLAGDEIDDAIAEHDPALWNIIRAERDALFRLDVPRFTAPVDSKTLFADGHQIHEIITTPGIERAKQRFKTLDQDTILSQRDYIQLSADPVAYQPTDSHVYAVDHTDKPSGDRISAAVENIYDRVADASKMIDPAENQKTREYSWVLHQKVGADTLDIRPIGDGFYEGRLGIAVFAALVGRYCEREDAHKMAVTIGQNISKRLDDNKNQTEPMPLGLGEGAASYVYGFTLLGRITGVGDFISHAEEIAISVSVSDRELSEEPSIMGGEAGLTAALVTLYETTGNDAILDSAVECADCLVDAGAETLTGGFEEKSSVTTGFAHGIAGMAYALDRVSEHVEADNYRNISSKLREILSKSFDSDIDNWPDTRLFTDREMDGWCRGRSGIISSYFVDDTALPEKIDGVELDTILEVITRDIQTDVDHFCCGTAGRINTLLTASERMEVEKFREDALNALRELLGGGETSSHFYIHGHTPRLPNPTLFQGLAGIGVVALRCLHSDVPDIARLR